MYFGGNIKFKRFPKAKVAQKESGLHAFGHFRARQSLLKFNYFSKVQGVEAISAKRILSILDENIQKRILSQPDYHYNQE